MKIGDFVLDNLNRIQKALTVSIDSLTYEELTWQPDDEANSIGFLLWHIARCEDTYIQGMVLHQPQVWVAEGWFDRMSITDDPRDLGYGYTAERLTDFRVPDLKDLLGYAGAVRKRTTAFLESLDDEKCDESIDHPAFGGITVAGLMSYMLCELTQHIGQIAYLRGLQRGLNG